MRVDRRTTQVTALPAVPPAMHISRFLPRFAPKNWPKNSRYHANVSEGVSFCPPQIVFIGEGSIRSAPEIGQSPGLRCALLTRDAPLLSRMSAQVTSPSVGNDRPTSHGCSVVEDSGLEPVILVFLFQRVLRVPRGPRALSCRAEDLPTARSLRIPAWQQASGSGRCVPDPHPFHDDVGVRPSPITHHPATPPPRHPITPRPAVPGRPGPACADRRHTPRGTRRCADRPFPSDRSLPPRCPQVR